MNPNDEIREEDIPEELYAPLGNLTFKKPNTTEDTTIEQTSNSIDDTKPPLEKEEVEPEILSYKDVKIEYAKKPFNTKKLIISIVTIIVIALFSIALYLYQINNKNILRLGVNNIANTVEKTVYSIKDSDFLAFNLDKPFRSSILLSLDTIYDSSKLTEEEYNFLKMMNDIAASITLDMDYTKKEFTYDIKTTYLNGNIFEVYGNANKDGITYKIKDVIGKYISYPIDNFKRFYIAADDDKKDLDKVKSIVLKTLFLNIKEEDLKREKVSIKIGNKNIKVKDVSLVIDNKYLKELLSKTMDDLLNNEEFINETMSYTNLTSTRLKELMHDLKENVNKTIILESPITFHIYSKGITNKIIGYKLTFKNDKQYDIEYLYYNNILSLNINENNDEYLRFNMDTSDDKKYNYSLNFLDYDFKMDRIVQKDNILYEYSLNQKNQEQYTGTVITTDETSKNAKDGTAKLTITKIDSNKEKLFDLYATINYNVKTLSEINLYDDEGAVEYKTLTIEDRKEIKRRIEKVEYFDLLKTRIKSLYKKKS